MTTVSISNVSCRVHGNNERFMGHEGGGGRGGREGVAYNINPIQDLVIRMSNIVLARFYCL